MTFGYCLSNLLVKAGSLLSLALLIAACTAAPPQTVILPTLAVLPSATATPSATWTSSPTFTPSQTPTATHTPTATLTPSQTPPPTNTPTATDTLTPTPTASWTPTPSDTLTPTITLTPSWTSSPTDADAAVSDSGSATVSMTSQQLVELQDGPGFKYGSIEPLASGTALSLIGRSWDNQWYQVRLSSGEIGWVYGLYLVIWSDTNQLPVSWQQPTEPPVVTVGSFALGGQFADTKVSAFGLAHSAGMTWIKLQYRYYVGQNASEIAADIQTIHQNGFKILVGLVGDKAQMGDYNSYIASYAGFAAEVAALGADAIEVWNEPNLDREWPDGMIQGGTYTQLLAAAYTAIKARAPGTLVISAAPAPTGFFGGSGCDTSGCNDDIFFKQMAFAGAQNYLDCVGLHHNDGIVSPLQSSGDPRGNYPTNYLLGVIGRVPPQFNSKPLCFTELGYLSPQGYGGLPGNFAWAQNTTVADQAQWLAQAVQLTRSTGRVEMLIVWNVDFTTYTASDPMAGYAILRPGGSCPACDSLKSAVG